ncbi:MAG: phosphatase PAP2 family protein [Verrucomicrobiales bacterium]|nr:phosphatase PAP2 family protein [Verrucomicrobiales bacterium]
MESPSQSPLLEIPGVPREPFIRPASPAVAVPRTPRGLLVHEVVFGVFLVTAWVRSMGREGPLGSGSLGDGGLLVLNGALIAACWMRESAGWWRLRLLFYGVAVNLVYFFMREGAPRAGQIHHDLWLNSIDVALLGQTPAMGLKSFRAPALTDVFSLCYLFFYLYVITSLIRALSGNLSQARRFMAGLVTIYGVGYLGYELVPASGPYVAFASEFGGPLTGGWPTSLNAAVVRFGSNGVDVFPSLHCAVSAFILFFDARFHRSRFWWCLVPCIGLWISTLYLGYHYAVDVICGFALTALGLTLAFRRPGGFGADVANPA